LADGNVIYRLRRRDMIACLVDIAAKLPGLLEHPAELWRPDREKRLPGRKVWYRNQPARIVRIHWANVGVGK
jgi:hypothetical protein